METFIIRTGGGLLVRAIKVQAKGFHINPLTRRVMFKDCAGDCVAMFKVDDVSSVVVEGEDNHQRREANGLVIPSGAYPGVSGIEGMDGGIEIM